MPHSSHFQFTALDLAIPQWHVQYTLAQLARGDPSTFPSIDTDTVTATRAAILTRGIQLPPFHLEVLVWLYQRLSRSEQVALRLMNLANIGPRDGMVRNVGGAQINVLCQLIPDSEHVTSPRDTNCATSSALQPDYHHLSATPSQNDFDRVFQDLTGNLSNNQGPSSPHITDMTHPIPSQKDSFHDPQPRCFFTYNPAEEQIIEGDHSGAMAFLEYSTTFSYNPPRQQTIHLMPTAEELLGRPLSELQIIQLMNDTNAHSQSYAAGNDQIRFD